MSIDAGSPGGPANRGSPAEAPGEQALALRSFAFNRLSAIAAVLDGEGRIVDTNEAWRLFAHLNDGAPAATGPGVSYLEVCDRAAANGAGEAAAVAVGLRQILAGERDRFDLEYRSASPTEDSWFLVQASSAPVLDGAGMVLFHVDITARKLREDRFAARAEQDELTGLPDRHATVRAIEAHLADARRTGVPVWVLVVDLDGLGAVDDRHGRHLGDELVVKVVARARRAVRDADLLGRFSEGQLVLICPDLGVDGARALSGRLRSAMSEPFQFGATEVSLGVTVGGAASGADSTVDDLLAAADAQRHGDTTGHGERRGVDPRGRARRSPVSRQPRVHSHRRDEDRPERPATRAAEAAARVAVRASDRCASRRLLDTIFGSAHDVVMFVLADGTIDWVSSASGRLFGAGPSQLVGRHGIELVHPDDQARVRAEFATISQLGDQVRTEYRTVGPDGDVHWVEEIATNLIDEPGVGAIVGHLRDVTDRKQAEEAARFQARLLAAAGQPVVAADRGGLVIYWNDAAEATYGWTAGEVQGRRVSDLLIPSGGLGPVATVIRANIDGGRAWSGELLAQRKDGRQIPVLVSYTPLFDDEGDHIATIGVSTDISDRRRSAEMGARLAAIVESSSDAIFSQDLSGVVTTWNGGAAALYGHTEAESIGRNLRELIPAEHVDQLRLLLEDAGRGAGGARRVEIETVGRDTDGRDLHVSLSTSYIRDASGQVVAASAIARDVTEQAELRLRVEEDRRRLADAQASAGLGCFEIDLDTRRVTRSDELCRILGVEQGGTRAFGLDHVHPEDRARVAQSLEQALDGQVGVEWTNRIVRPDGTVRWVLSRTSRLGGPRSRTLAGTMLDITERHRIELALAHQVTHDRLTGLPNRTSLIESLRSLLSGPAANRRRVALAFVDLDEFKVVNDTLGHAAGDQVLCAVAHRLTTGLRETDIVVRVSGDEFVLVRADVDSLDEAEELATEAERVLGPPVTVGDRQFQLSASIGVTLSDPSDTSEVLLRDADAAMYQAKDDGRARIIVFDARARARAQRRLTLEAGLRQAVARDELHLEFQPILDLSTGTAAGFESLLRWDHPTLGPVSPEEFIPIAESSGMILPIGDWVLDHALAQLARWRSDPRFRSDVWLAVNLSAAQLGQPHLVDRVARVIVDADLPPELIHLEITESVLMDRVEDAVSTIEALRALGVRISIDDFGTGSSSLSYLRRLPIDILKIDRSFVVGLGGGGDDTSIVGAITSLAHSLGLHIVAEGIERPDQLAPLLELGCTFGQGFLWSRPLRPDAALAWLVARDGTRPDSR